MTTVVTLLKALAAVLLVVGLLAYLRVGWWRMESACLADPPGSTRDTSSVELGYSLVPLGFHCTFGDGQEETSLWF